MAFNELHCVVVFASKAGISNIHRAEAAIAAVSAPISMNIAASANAGATNLRSGGGRRFTRPAATFINSYAAQVMPKKGAAMTTPAKKASALRKDDLCPRLR